MEKYSVHFNGEELVRLADEEQAWERFRVERARARYADPAVRVELREDGELRSSWEPREDFTGASVRDFLQGKGRSGDLFLVREGWDADSEDFEDGGSVSFGVLESVKRADVDELAREGALVVYVPPACSGSDYNGGALARANARALRELAEAEGLVSFELHGGHGSHGTAFPLWERSDELVRVLEGLEDYPVVDEDAHSEEELADEEQAWDSWIRSDFSRALQEETGVDVSDVKDEDLRSLLHTRMEAAGRYFEHSDEGPHVDVDELADGVERSELLALEGSVSAEADEEEHAARVLRTIGEAWELAPLHVRELVRENPAGEDRRPVLRAWEELSATLRERFRVLDYSDGGGLVSFARQVAEWPIGAEPAEGATADELRKELRSLRETVERVRDAARASVLPVLPSVEGIRGRADCAARWGRDEETGLLLEDAFRDRVERVLRDEGVRHGEDRRRTLGLRYAGERERVEALRTLGRSPEDAARAVLLDRVRERLKRGGGVLPPEGRGWADVLEVGDADVLLQRKDGTAPERFPLERFLRRGDF